MPTAAPTSARMSTLPEVGGPASNSNVRASASRQTGPWLGAAERTPCKRIAGKGPRPDGSPGGPGLQVRAAAERQPIQGRRLAAMSSAEVRVRISRDGRSAP